MTTKPLDRILREPEVKRVTGLSRTTRWRKVKAGTFPPPVEFDARHQRLARKYHCQLARRTPRESGVARERSAHRIEKTGRSVSCAPAKCGASNNLHMD